MKTLLELKEYLDELEKEIRTTNACAYTIGIGTVSETTIQKFISLKELYNTVVRARGLETYYDELNVVELFLEYYSPEVFCLYYKDLTKENKESIRSSYKHWKSIHDSVSELIVEKSKNILIEEEFNNE